MVKPSGESSSSSVDEESWCPIEDVSPFDGLEALAMDKLQIGNLLPSVDSERFEAEARALLQLLWLRNRPTDTVRCHCARSSPLRILN